MTAVRGDEFLFLPLGGAAEIGMNLNLYGYGPPGSETWIIVDFGVTFGDSRAPGADVVLPDPAFCVARRHQIAGLVLTHAHEDHLGAVPYLWSEIGCPIYATPFTAAVLRRKWVDDGGSLDDLPIHEVPLGGRFRLGPFDIELVTVTHSIPEPNALAIRTPLGMALHTGDWKFDSDPVIGETADFARLKELGHEGVLALVGDSTNALVEGDSKPEGGILAPLTQLVSECRGCVLISCFATNVARLSTIAAAAAASGRDVVLSGRSLRRIESAARESGLLAETTAFIDEREFGSLPRDRVVVICTGSQGEPRASLSRIAEDGHPHIGVVPGDRVILSSRVIPGNETAIGRVINRLVRRAIEVVTWDDADIHVSGHPTRGDLARMYGLTRPGTAIPVHGEARHLVAHARLALNCQVPNAVVPDNGTLIRLAPGKPGIVDHVPAGRLVWDDVRALPLNSPLIRDRARLLMNGTVLLTLVLAGGRLAVDPAMSSFGLLDGDRQEVEELAFAAVRRTFGALTPREAADDATVREAVRVAVRRVFRDALGKRPLTEVHVVRLGGAGGSIG